MKTRTILLLSAVGLTSVNLALRAEPVSDTEPAQRDLDVSQMQPANGLGDLRRANEIIGADIRDTHGARIGQVRELGLDLQNGRIAEVIVATLGESAKQEKFTAVPPESFVCEGPPMTLRLRSDLEQLQNAPSIDFKHWNDANGNAQLAAVYSQFGATPYFVDGTAPTGSSDIQRGQVTHYYSFPAKSPLVNVGYIARASKLVGTTAWNIQGQKLARVDNFVVDIPQGRVVEVVLGQGGFLGMGRQLCAVPPQAFRLSRNSAVLGLDTTQEALDAAPHFKESEWQAANQQNRIADVYSLYNINPYFIKGEMNSSAENVRAKVDCKEPTAESGNKADMDTTAQIRKALAADSNLAAEAKRLKIATSDGKVTLTGEVSNADVKRQIGDAVAKIVSADKVDNLLDVNATPLSTPDQ